MRRKKGVQEGFNTFLNALFLFHFISKMFSFFLQSNNGGNECGVFKKMYPDMDIVTSGSIYVLNHTPEEYLDLESFDRTYGFLLDFLRAL